MSFKLSCTEWFFLTVTKQKVNICPVILVFVNPRKGLVFIWSSGFHLWSHILILNWNSQPLPAWTGLNSSAWSLHSVKCGCITLQTHASGKGSWNISHSYKQTWQVLLSTILYSCVLTSVSLDHHYSWILLPFQRVWDYFSYNLSIKNFS